MIPSIATILCIILIVFLFRIDARTDTAGVSGAVWVPYVWMFFAASRFASHWLGLEGSGDPLNVALEGSPIDRVIFLALMLLGIIILARRRINIRKWFAANPWVWAYFMFGALSLLWSNYPGVSLKRLLKASGNIVMALVILTEDDPRQALGVIMRRLAYILLPLSVLFIKYYPDLGRAYHMGSPMFTGVAGQKNELGQTCLLVGIYFCWSLLLNRREKSLSRTALNSSIYIIMLPMLVWLLYVADSVTSILTFAIGLAIIIASRLPSMKRRPMNLIKLGIITVASIIVLNAVFNLSSVILAAFGRDSSLTTRVPMWSLLMSRVDNPILGEGFESFWLGGTLVVIRYLYGVSNAHNGYLEIYLSLGIIGLILVILSMLHGLSRLRIRLTEDYAFSVLKLTFLVVIAVYNWTEATFFGVNDIWVLLIVSVMDGPLPSSAPQQLGKASPRQESK